MKKRHYFLISYTAFLENKTTSVGSLQLDRNSRNINNQTLDFINNHILTVVNDNNAKPIITSISYLGYMTSKEFNDE